MKSRPVVILISIALLYCVAHYAPGIPLFAESTDSYQPGLLDSVVQRGIQSAGIDKGGFSYDPSQNNIMAAKQGARTSSIAYEREHLATDNPYYGDSYSGNYNSYY